MINNNANISEEDPSCQEMCARLTVTLPPVAIVNDAMKCLALTSNLVQQCSGAVKYKEGKVGLLREMAWTAVDCCLPFLGSFLRQTRDLEAEKRLGQPDTTTGRVFGGACYLDACTIADK